MEILNKEKILIIQTAFLGDAVLTLPMIQKLKEKFQNAYVSVLCIPSAEELFASSPFVDECIIYDKHGMQKSLKSFLELLKTIRFQKFTRIYSPHRSLRSTLISYFSRTENTTAFDTAAFSFLYKNKIKYNSSRHEVARNLELIGEDTDKEKWRILPVIEVKNETEEKIDELIKVAEGKEIVAVAPGSVWATKKYPAEYFVEVIKNFINLNHFIVLVGGKDDKELCAEIENKFPWGIRSFAGELSIKESVALLKKCKILISNDSAPTHLGMIADIPVLTIFCSTIPDFGFYPYNKRSNFISYDLLDCKPCGIHGHNVCPVKTFDCGVKLVPDDIFTKLKRMAIL